MLYKDFNQHELSYGPLLNEKGDLNEAGYSNSLIREYARHQIKGLKTRIKEWDYYYFGNAHYGVALTIADNSYMSMLSASFLDFDHQNETTKSKIKFFSFGKLKLPRTSKTGDIVVQWGKTKFSFKHENGRRHISVFYPRFAGENDLNVEVFLEETTPDSLVIATPFLKKKHFYYNQKINLLSVNGYCKFGDQLYNFDESCYGVLDWGRGVWTYSNTWYWSSLNAEYKGKRIGFNLGYGFGDTSKASENIFYYDGNAYKLGDVRFDIPTDENGKPLWLETWKFRSSDGSINLSFQPVLNRHANLNVGIIKSIQNQVFGQFSGYILVEGKEVYFENLLGFAEKVHNCW